VSPRLRAYFGDSRGTGSDTLVVDVTNFPASRANYQRRRALRRQALSAQAPFGSLSDDRDPATFSRPWTAALSLKTDNRLAQVPGTCHEGNCARRTSSPRLARKSGSYRRIVAFTSRHPAIGDGIGRLRRDHRFAVVEHGPRFRWLTSGDGSARHWTISCAPCRRVVHNVK
jgi:hypothetical protein